VPMRSLNFLNDQIDTDEQGSAVYLASNRNELQKQKNMFLRSRTRPVCRADKIAANCEPIF
jgi:hypothetical protein